MLTTLCRPRSETLRQDMSEDQEGVPLYLDIGVMDVNSCDPLPNVLVDIWYALRTNPKWYCKKC